MPKMVKRPVPIPTPTFVPRFRLVCGLLGSVVSGGEVEDVDDDVEDELSPNGTFMIAAKDNACSLGNSERSVDFQKTAIGIASAVPVDTTVGLLIR